MYPYLIFKKYNKQVNARDIWVKILDAQMETGTPYLLYKDAATEKPVVGAAERLI